jgi:hypothetical protein
MVGTNWQQSVSQILSIIEHYLNIASPEQPADAQMSANQRSVRLSLNLSASAPQQKRAHFINELDQLNRINSHDRVL